MLVNLHNLPGLASTVKNAAGMGFDPEFGPIDAATGDLQTEMPLSFEKGTELPGIDAAQPTQSNSFAQLLTQAIDTVNAQDHKAAITAFDYATGKSIDTHTVMIEMAKAQAEIHIAASVATKAASGLQTLFNLQI